MSEKKPGVGLRVLFVLAAATAVYGGVGIYANSQGPQKADAEKALRQHGFSQIETKHSYLTGMFRCSRGEMYNSYEFTAKNQRNEDVSGYVCQGVFKGATIRY